MKRYKHIFFDLDDTLWDFYANSNEALRHLFVKYRLEDHFLEPDALLKAFHDVNNQLWVLYRNNEIDKDYLRNQRFGLVFEKLNNKSFRDLPEFGKEYLALCPVQKNLVRGAEDILSYLKKKYRMHVITNGFVEIAGTKLECSGLHAYFDEIVTSEHVQSKKPDPGIFEYALSVAKADRSESIMIGNDWEADVIGAMQAGIDQVYYNPENLVTEKKPTYEIRHLSELRSLL